MKNVIGVYGPGSTHWVGDGFPVRNLFPSNGVGNEIDPFLMLDYAGPRYFEPSTKPRGVGEHPHRGFETVTIAYQGAVDHRDSAGNSGTIYPGDVVGDDLVTERAFIAHTVTRAAVYESREMVIGKVAKRTLLPGQPVSINALRDPYVVNQGKSAVIVFETSGLTITTHATALQNGGIGDEVSLRNVDSGAIVKGTVAADGTVRLATP